MEGSKIQLPIGSELRYEALPDGGLRFIHKKPFKLITFIIFVGFITFWFMVTGIMTFSEPNNGFITIFMIPFWLVGFFVSVVLFSVFFKKEIIDLYPKEVHYRRKQLIGKKNYRLHFNEIDVLNRQWTANIEKRLDTSSLENLKQSAPIHVRYGAVDDYWFSDLSEGDTVWLFNLLHQVWEKRHGQVL
jgi:hypothetical protein